MALSKKFGPPQDGLPESMTAKRISDTFIDIPTRKLTVEFDSRLHSELKQYAAREGKTMREVLEGLVRGLVAE